MFTNINYSTTVAKHLYVGGSELLDPFPFDYKTQNNNLERDQLARLVCIADIFGETNLRQCGKGHHILLGND